MWMLQCIRFQNLEGFPSGVISTNEPTNYPDLMLFAINLCYTLPYDLFSIHYPPTHLPCAILLQVYHEVDGS